MILECDSLILYNQNTFVNTTIDLSTLQLQACEGRMQATIMSVDDADNSRQAFIDYRIDRTAPELIVSSSCYLNENSSTLILLSHCELELTARDDAADNIFIEVSNEFLDITDNQSLTLDADTLFANSDEVVVQVSLTDQANRNSLYTLIDQPANLQLQTDIVNLLTVWCRVPREQSGRLRRHHHGEQHPRLRFLN